MRYWSVYAFACILAACSNGTPETDLPVGYETGGEVSMPDMPPMPKSLRLEDIDFTTYSTELAKSVGLSEGQSRIDAIDAVRLYFAPEEGAHIVQTAQSSFDRPDGSVLIMSVSGLADDSIGAQEIYLILTGPVSDQKLAAYGLRQKCWRGENTEKWTIDSCP